MTKGKAEYLVGAEIEIRNLGRGNFAAAAKGINCEGKGRSQDDAIRSLVAAVDHLNSRAAMQRDDYRCSRCGTFGGLGSHHIKFRSRGGTHALSNRETLCALCHEKAHNTRKRTVIVDASKQTSEIQSAAAVPGSRGQRKE